MNKIVISLNFRFSKNNYTYGEIFEEYMDLDKDFGSTLSDRRNVKLSCHK